MQSYMEILRDRISRTEGVEREQLMDDLDDVTDEIGMLSGQKWNWVGNGEVATGKWLLRLGKHPQLMHFVQAGPWELWATDRDITSLLKSIKVGGLA